MLGSLQAVTNLEIDRSLPGLNSKEYRIHHFSVDSQYPLPAQVVAAPQYPAGSQRPGVAKARHIVRVRRTATRDEMTTFSHAALLGRLGNGTLRSYWVEEDTAHTPESAILLCALGETGPRLKVCGQGEELLYEEGDDSQGAVPGLTNAVTGVCLTGVALSVCALLRGHLPLHACSFDLPHSGKRVGIMANSGSGKSTLLCYLLTQGARLGSDDVTMVGIGEDRIPWAAPSISLPIKLCEDTLRHFFPLQELDILSSVIPGLDKRYLPVDIQDRSTDESPLSALFLLAPSDSETKEVRWERKTRSEAITSLYGNIHGLWSVVDALPQGALLRVLAQLSAAVPIYVLRYRKEFSVLPRLQEAIFRLA